MRRLVVSLVLVALCIGTVAGAAEAQAKPEFKLGFKALADQIPGVVGEPLENEHWGSNGDSLQRTTTGLMVWRKADNWTAFTDGARTWINGPNGLLDRANVDRFDWEAGGRPASAPAAPSRSADPRNSDASAVARLIPSVVQVRTSDAMGTGFVIEGDIVLTNQHVVGDSTSLTIATTDGRQLLGTVTARSCTIDVALMSVPNLNLPHVNFSSPSNLRPGDTLLVLGYPLGLPGQPSISRGVFSTARRGGASGDWIQTDAAMNPGSSGGPVATDSGEVVGVSTWGIRLEGTTPVEGINFALSADTVQDLLPSMLSSAAQSLASGRSPAPCPTTETRAGPVAQPTAVPTLVPKVGYKPEVRAMDGRAGWVAFPVAGLAAEVDSEWSIAWGWRPSRPTTTYVFSDSGSFVDMLRVLKGSALTDWEKETLPFTISAYSTPPTGNWAVLLNAGTEGSQWVPLLGTHAGWPSRVVEAYRASFIKEYASLMFADKGLDQDPKTRWFRIGFIDLLIRTKVINEEAEAATRSVMSYNRDQKTVTLRKLQDNLDTHLEKGVAVAHGIAYYAARFLADKYGPGILMEVLIRARDGGDFEVALKEVTGYTLDELDTAYRTLIPRSR